MPEPATYAIICDAKTGNSKGLVILALTDKAKAPADRHNKMIWWIADNPDVIMRYRSSETAEQHCSKFKYNNPRVVFFDDAYAMIEMQRKGLEKRHGA